MQIARLEVYVLRKTNVPVRNDGQSPGNEIAHLGGIESTHNCFDATLFHSSNSIAATVIRLVFRQHLLIHLATQEKRRERPPRRPRRQTLPFAHGRTKDIAQQPAHAGCTVEGNKPSVAWPVCSGTWFGPIRLSTPFVIAALAPFSTQPDHPLDRCPPRWLRLSAARFHENIV